MLTRSFTYKLLVTFVAFFVFLFSIPYAGAAEAGLKLVENADEFISAVNDPNITSIRIKKKKDGSRTIIATSSNIDVQKPIEINGNTWNISGGMVKINSNINIGVGGRLNVKSGGVVVAYASVNQNGGTVKIDGEWRIPMTFKVDCKSGRVDSVTYAKEVGVDTSFVSGSVVVDGKISVLVLADSPLKAKKVKSICIDGIAYKTSSVAERNTGTYYREYLLRYIVNGIEEKYSPTSFVCDSTGKKLPVISMRGFTFKGWGTTETGTPVVNTKQLTVAQLSGNKVTLYAIFEEGEQGEQPSEERGENGMPFHGRGGFSGRGGSGAILVETTVEEEDDELSSGDRGGDKTGGPAEASTPQANNNGGQRRRVSVASNKTKTTFEEKGPRSEDVGVTIERDKMDRFGPMIAGGVLILLAIVLMVVLHYLSRKNKRHF